MSSSESDKLKEIAMRVDVLERIVTTPIVSKRDMRIIVASLIALSIVAIIGVIGELYIVSQVNNIYSLLESV